jgi:hypothetical protein
MERKTPVGKREVQQGAGEVAMVPDANRARSKLAAERLKKEVRWFGRPNLVTWRAAEIPVGNAK